MRAYRSCGEVVQISFAVASAYKLIGRVDLDDVTAGFVKDDTKVAVEKFCNR